jgi:hypothetical protein
MPFGGIFGKSEEERFVNTVAEWFSASSDADIKRAQKRVSKRAAENPQETITALLRNYNHEDTHVRLGVKGTLVLLSDDRENHRAILSAMVHPSRDVRKAVQDFLGDIHGAHAVTYASFYEQTMLMVAMSKRKEIPVDDLVSLANLTKETFIDGEVMQAVQDIGFCLDHIKHRYKSSEQLKTYVADLLKMAPDLSRMGVYDGNIEGPLRKAMKASQHREFDETREIIEERIRESRMRSYLHQITAEVKDSIKERPSLKVDDLVDNDKELVQDQHLLVESVTSLLLAGKRSEAIDSMLAYQSDFIAYYAAELSERVRSGDVSAAASLYNITMILVKLASYIAPMTAEDVYQKRFRQLEGDPSIHVVMWPESVIVYQDAERLGRRPRVLAR